MEIIFLGNLLVIGALMAIKQDDKDSKFSWKEFGGDVFCVATGWIFISYLATRYIIRTEEMKGK